MSTSDVCRERGKSKPHLQHRSAPCCGIAGAPCVEPRLQGGEASRRRTCARSRGRTRRLRPSCVKYGGRVLDAPSRNRTRRRRRPPKRRKGSRRGEDGEVGEGSGRVVGVSHAAEQLRAWGGQGGAGSGLGAGAGDVAQQQQAARDEEGAHDREEQKAVDGRVAGEAVQQDEPRRVRVRARVRVGVRVRVRVRVRVGGSVWQAAERGEPARRRAVSRKCVRRARSSPQRGGRPSRAR